MHPAEEIYCEKSNKLRGKTVVIGITGSIAATECFSTIRELIRHGAKIIEINPEPTTFTSVITDIFLQGKATEVMEALTQELEHS